MNLSSVVRSAALSALPVAYVFAAVASPASAQVVARTMTRVEHTLIGPQLVLGNRDPVFFAGASDFRQSTAAAPVSLDGSVGGEVAVGDGYSRASATSTAFASAGLLRLGLDGEVAQKTTPTQRSGGAQLSSQQVKVSWRDTYLFLGNPAQPQPGRLVQINAFLNLSGVMDVQTHIEHTRYSDAGAAAQVQLTLAGRDHLGRSLVPGPAGGSMIAFRTGSTTPTVAPLYTAPPGVIPVTMLAVEGQESQMSFEMTLQATAQANNYFDAPRPSEVWATFEADFTHTASWGGVTSVTDVNTGASVSGGWSMTAASGTDYARAVPEPAGAAALLVVCGLAARRRGHATSRPTCITCPPSRCPLSAPALTRSGSPLRVRRRR